MPRLRVIILDSLPGPRPAFHIALWADVPVGRQSFYANAANKSQWTGALAADTAALVAGSIVERVETYVANPGETVVAIKADLQTLWSVFQNQVNTGNPWNHYGTTWDGTTWVDTGAT